MNQITQIFIADLLKHIDEMKYADNPEHSYIFNDVKVTIKLEKVGQYE